MSGRLAADRLGSKRCWLSLLYLARVDGIDPPANLDSWSHHHNGKTVLNKVFAVAVIQVAKTLVLRPRNTQFVEEHFGPTATTKEEDPLVTMPAIHWKG